MAFEAILNSDNMAQSAYDTLVITDASSWDGLTTADFTSRYITIVDANGDTPTGFDATISFPLVDGLGDTLEITFSSDLAITMTLTYVPVTPDASATFTKEITTIFSGNAKSLHSSRTHKTEVAGTVRAANVPKYRETTTVLANLIDSSEYEASVGNLSSAQSLLDRAAIMDIDTITF